MPTPQNQSSLCDQSSACESKPIAVGHALLGLALSIQQLPPDFDFALLEMHDAESKVESYIANVSSLVLADEELLCSPEGVTCLLLLGMIYINDGMLQKAWLTFRRALDTSRLLGLHGSYSVSARTSGTPEVIAQRRM